MIKSDAECDNAEFMLLGAAAPFQLAVVIVVLVAFALPIKFKNEEFF